MKGKKHSLVSRKKMSESQKGKIPWIKGKKHTQETKKKMSMAAIGRIPWNKGKKFEHRQDENSYQYKGSKASYSAIHHWVNKRRGTAKKCSKCGSTVNCQWSNVDHLYKRVLEDYKELCAKCHNKYDRKLKITGLKEILNMRALATCVKGYTYQVIIAGKWKII